MCHRLAAHTTFLQTTPGPHVSCVLSFAHHHFFFVGWTFGMQLRISTTTLLYDKILRLRLSSLGQVFYGTKTTVRNHVWKRTARVKSALVGKVEG